MYCLVQLVTYSYFNLIKTKKKFSVPFQAVIISCMWLGATILDSTERKFLSLQKVLLDSTMLKSLLGLFGRKTGATKEQEVKLIRKLFQEFWQEMWVT